MIQLLLIRNFFYFHSRLSERDEKSIVHIFQNKKKLKSHDGSHRNLSRLQQSSNVDAISEKLQTVPTSNHPTKN